MPSDIRSAIAARNRADRKDAILHFVLAAPFTLFGLGLANVFGLLLWYVLRTFGIPIGIWAYLAGFNVLLLVMIIVDLRRTPEESWHQPKYRLAGGGVRGHEFGAALGGSGNSIPSPEEFWITRKIESSKGIFSGMPLMTTMSDPHNLAERGRVLSNGFANLILGGPRSIRKGLAILRWNSERSRPRTIQSAERFMTWLGSRVVPETEVKARLEAHPDEAEGLDLAREVEVLTRRRLPEEFHYQRR
jgi:hypothetical protein